MLSTKKAANAIGGKTARACDSCLRKRARWYCAADDAFLCQSCDSSVHSANQLASRHERVRLEMSSSKAAIVSAMNQPSLSPPSWHQGFTRKARTRRQTKPSSLVLQPSKEEKITNPLALVPEIGNEEEASPDEDEENLLYRVPIFEPFSVELCEVGNNKVESERGGHEFDGILTNNGHRHDEGCEKDNLHGLFLPSDMDLAEFAADVESLLGTGLDEGSCGIEELGLLDCKGEDGLDRKVKVEDEDVEAVVACQLDSGLEMTTETIDWNFGYETSVTGAEEKAVAAVETAMMNGECKEEVERKIFLRLNYEAVIAAWSSQGSPWTTGIRPEFNPNDCWPDFMGTCPIASSHPCMEVGGHVRCGDGGREARVSRYREKRRTRLFSKKIRYEVRKLNAEKRPRMKGRFVKRTPFAGPAFPYLMHK